VIGTRPVASARLTLGAVLSAAALVMAVAPVRALPLYASREGTKCASCHFDPNGGGMRNEFGFNYDKNRHSMEEETKFGSVDVDPQLNDWIRLGLDMRTVYIGEHFEGSSGFQTYSFFPMQGNLRVAITPHEKLTVVGSHGIVVDEPGFPSPYLARELYAMVHDLPKGAFIQVGRFRVPFGLRQDDHTSFTRAPEFLPYDSQKEDAGIALGSVGKNGWFEFSYTNGEAIPTLGEAQAVAGKVAWAFPFLQGGISGYRDMGGVYDANRWSLYLTRTFRSLTLLGEYAGGTDESPIGDINNMAAFLEADYRVSRGVNVRGKFDYLDPDRDRDRELTRRYLIDLDLEPLPFTQVKLSYRRYHASAPIEALETPDRDEYLAQLFVPF
jgi:hypothetical protein